MHPRSGQGGAAVAHRKAAASTATGRQTPRAIPSRRCSPFGKRYVVGTGRFRAGTNAPHSGGSLLRPAASRGRAGGGGVGHSGSPLVARLLAFGKSVARAQSVTPLPKSQPPHSTTLTLPDPLELPRPSPQAPPLCILAASSFVFFASTSPFPFMAKCCIGPLRSPGISEVTASSGSGGWRSPCRA